MQQKESIILIIPQSEKKFIDIEYFKQGFGINFTNYYITSVTYYDNIEESIFNSEIKKVSKCHRIKYIISLFYNSFYDLKILDMLDLEFRDQFKTFGSSSNLEYYHFYGIRGKLSNKNIYGNIFLNSERNVAISEENEKLNNYPSALSQINGLLINNQTKLSNGDEPQTLPPETFINTSTSKQNISLLLKQKKDESLIFLDNTLYTLFRLAEKENYLVKKTSHLEYCYQVFDKSMESLGYFKLLPEKEINILVIAGATLQENGVIDFNRAKTAGICSSSQTRTN